VKTLVTSKEIGEVFEELLDRFCDKILVQKEFDQTDDGGFFINCHGRSNAAVRVTANKTRCEARLTITFAEPYASKQEIDEQMSLEFTNVQSGILGRTQEMFERAKGEGK
jgi:hypothetical protein